MSYSSIVSQPGSANTGFSLKSKQLSVKPVVQPMSDAEYNERRSKIETDYKNRLQELSVLIEHFKGRGHTDANTGPFDPANRVGLRRTVVAVRSVDVRFVGVALRHAETVALSPRTMPAPC